MDGSERRPGQRHLRLGDRPGDPEVDDLDLAVPPDQDVAGLDVTVDQTAGVGCREGPGDGRRDPGGLSGRQGAAATDDRREVLTVDQLHDDVRTGRILAVVVDGDDVRVAQRRGRLGLLAEPGREIGVAQVFRSQQLDRDVTAQLGVERSIDGRHAALAEQLDQPIATAQDRPDLRQAVFPLVGAPMVGASGGIVPHGPGAAVVRQSWSCCRYARNSVARSGRCRASSTDAFSQPIVVPAS